MLPKQPANQSADGNWGPRPQRLCQASYLAAGTTRSIFDVRQNVCCETLGVGRPLDGVGEGEGAAQKRQNEPAHCAGREPRQRKGLWFPCAVAREAR